MGLNNPLPHSSKQLTTYEKSIAVKEMEWYTRTQVQTIARERFGRDLPYTAGNSTERQSVLPE